MNREVAWFKTHRDPLKILTLIVGGEPMASLTPGREAEECFPRTLLYRVGADLQPTEDLGEAPLAADARETGDGKRGAKLKIAAALLGVGLDTLVRRDDRRRAERRRLVTAGLASLSLALGGLSIFAFTQRDAAVAAKKDAEFQRDEAQSLVEFMLTDLRQSLDAVGRLDILDAVAKRLLESYDKQDLAKLDPDALGRRARVLLLLGEVENTRGNLDAALARYKEAAATTGELLRRAPNSAQQIFDHAQSVFWVGYIAWQRGDAAEAKKQFTLYYDLAQQLVAIDPDKDEWRMEVKYALNNLGTLAMEQGDAAEAERNFRSSLAVALKFSAMDPKNVEKALSAGQAYAWLADSLFRQLKFSDAIAARSAEIQVYSDLQKQNPNNAEVALQLIVAKYSMAQLALAVNRLDEALTSAEIAAKLADQLLLVDTDNSNVADRSSFAFTVLGRVHFYRRDFVNARAALEKAVSIAEPLVRADDDVSEWRSVTLADANLAIGALDIYTKRNAAGLDRLSAMVKDFLPQMARPNTDPIIVRRYCSALAEKERLSGVNNGAWTEIVMRLAPLSAKNGPDALTILAEAYFHIGKQGEAIAIITQLFDAGYRHPDFLALLDKYPDLKAAAIAGTAAQ
ncbi:MAG: hypothetical protein A3E01_12340 [Gammaproteobacteria bacterium RIFCSPHIGHO2_12_FULL_63_22]|nr:MAG: hypothetical protein A3E01_12340 [Gammaproteobacteria bacterium RIFCSPHIGHO2_12_FULL_63_22]